MAQLTRHVFPEVLTPPKPPLMNPQNYLALMLDVTNQDDVDAAFKAAVDKFSRVDVVVNNAGYGLSGVFEELAVDQIKVRRKSAGPGTSRTNTI
jgi:NADP-dependent 3-hydroxy acid dehydrogenase YdfG